MHGNKRLLLPFSTKKITNSCYHISRYFTEQTVVCLDSLLITRDDTFLYFSEHNFLKSVEVVEYGFVN